MTAPTHRYHGTGLSRADGEDIETGEKFTPTDAELSAFGDLLEELPPEERGDGEDAEEEPPAATDAVADREFSVSEAKTVLENAGVDPEDYSELQSLAGEFEDVPGAGIGKEEMQKRLAEALDEQSE